MSSTNSICIYVPCCPVIADITTNSFFRAFDVHIMVVVNLTLWIGLIPKKKINPSLRSSLASMVFLIACMCTLVQQPTNYLREQIWLNSYPDIRIYNQSFKQSRKIIYYFGMNHDCKRFMRRKSSKEAIRNKHIISNRCRDM